MLLSLSIILKLSIICAVTGVAKSTNSFNYEIGPRVFENLKYLLQEVALATSMPSLQFQSGLLNLSNFNVNEVYAPGSQMFFVLKQLYFSKINTLNFGLENGFYYCMINHVDPVHPFPFNIELDVSDPSDLSIVKVYHVLPNGQPDFAYNDCHADPNVCPFNFRVTGRPWYVQGKSSTSVSWTAPFLQTFPTVPTVAISYPLFDRRGVFAGVISANVLLDQISSFLQSSYNTTDRSVFVVDRSTGYLIASSMGDVLYTGSAAGGDLAMIVAKDSPNYIISGATQKLIESNWPDYLVIFEDYYLQGVPYHDAIPGIFWTIVVLMPAQMQDAYLPINDPLYGLVVTVSILSCLAAMLGFFFTLYYRKTRLMKLTCPRLTRIVLFACLMLSISAALMAGPNSDSLCGVRPWLLNLSFTLGIAPLLAKSYMIHYIFNLDPLKRNKYISLSWVLLFTFVLLTVDVLLISIFGYGGNHKIQSVIVTELLQNGAYGQLTLCSFFQFREFVIAQVIFKGLMLISACYLCWKIRRVSDLLAGRWGLILTVYTTSIVCVVLLVVLSAISSVPTRVAIVSVGICFCSVVTSASMTLPNLYELWTNGDVNATNEVLASVSSTTVEDQSRRIASSPRPQPNPVPFSFLSFSWTKSVGDAVLKQVKPQRYLVLPVLNEGANENGTSHGEQHS